MEEKKNEEMEKENTGIAGAVYSGMDNSRIHILLDPVWI